MLTMRRNLITFKFPQDKALLLPVSVFYENGPRVQNNSSDVPTWQHGFSWVPMFQLVPVGFNWVSRFTFRCDTQHSIVPRHPDTETGVSLSTVKSGKYRYYGGVPRGTVRAEEVQGII